MSRPSNTSDRRAQIADALLALLPTHGYDGAAIADIARRAGLAPGLVHYHFACKLDILLAAIARLAERHLARLDAELAAHAAPRRQLAAALALHLGTGARAEPAAVAAWVLVGAEALREPRVQVAYEAALAAIAERLAAVIARGVAQRQFRRVDPRAAAGALLALVQGYFVVAAGARALIPAGSAAGCAHAMAAGLLAPAPRRRAR